MTKEVKKNQIDSIVMDVINTTDGLSNYLTKLEPNHLYRIHFSLGQAQSAILIDTQTNPMQIWSRNLDPRPERIAKETLSQFLKSKGIDPTSQLKDSFQTLNRWEQIENFSGNLISTMTPFNIEAAFKNIDDARKAPTAKVSKTGLFSTTPKAPAPISDNKKKFDL